MLNSPSACRHGHPCEVDGIKEAATCGIQHDPTIEGSRASMVAALIHVKPGTLLDGVNPNEPDWLSLKHLDTVAIGTASHPVIARHYAKLQGGFFYKVNGGSFDQATATSVREFGEFLSTLASGPLTPALVARVEKEGNEAMAAIKAAIESTKVRAAIG